MDDAFVPFFLLLGALAIGTLLVTAIPRLTAGFLIGRFVRPRDHQTIAIISFGAIGTVVSTMLMNPASVDLFTILAIIAALLIMTSIGASIGRRFARTAD